MSVNHMMIRQTTIADVSRIAEILIFTKRINDRKIFHNDSVSFEEIQVYPLAQHYIDHPNTLDRIWVYDHEFVKGMVYTDSFFKIKVLAVRL